MLHRLLHHRKTLSLIAVTFLIVLIISGKIAYAEIQDTSQTRKIENLNYRSSLFNYYQGKFFSAISDLVVAKKNKEDSTNDNNVNFLLGSAYRSYGLHNKAAEVYEKIIEREKENPTNKESSLENNSVLDKAWFQLGKTHYQSGQISAAEKTLYAVTNTLNDSYEDERLFLLSNIYMQSSRMREARQAQGYFRTKSIWFDYTTFNLGAQLIKDGKTIPGIKYLKELTEKAVPENRERRILQDKANLALGYTLLKHKNAIEAGKHFESIRLNDTESTNALLGSGLAWYMQSNFQKTLAPWLELSSRDQSDPYVQEALITLPNSFEKTNNLQQALYQYDLAVKSYRQQLSLVEASITTLQSGEFITALRDSVASDESSSPINLIDNLNGASNQYLRPLITTAEFHKALVAYQETASLNYILNQWNQNLHAFNSVLREKENWYRSALTDKALRPMFNLSNRHKEKRVDLSGRLDIIIKNEELIKLATPEEQKDLDLINKASAIINQNTTAFSHESKKLKLMSGLIYWDLTANYKQRSRQAQSRLRNLDTDINKTDSSIASLGHARQVAPNTFAKIKQLIKDKQLHVKQLQKKIAASLLAQEKTLVNIALRTTYQKRDRLLLYSDRAAFARARLYDSLAEKNNDE